MTTTDLRLPTWTDISCAEQARIQVREFFRTHVSDGIQSDEPTPKWPECES